MNAKAEKKLSEAEIIHLARNALIAAGMEIGKDGDHWPVIKDTVYQIMRDWEELKTERAVQDEMKKHLYTQLDLMQQTIPSCPEDIRPALISKINKLREVYDAFFTPVDDNELYLDDIPDAIHVQRAQAIIQTLEDDNG